MLTVNIPSDVFKSFIWDSEKIQLLLLSWKSTHPILPDSIFRVFVLLGICICKLCLSHTGNSQRPLTRKWPSASHECLVTNQALLPPVAMLTTALFLRFLECSLAADEWEDACLDYSLLSHQLLTVVKVAQPVLPKAWDYRPCRDQLYGFPVSGINTRERLIPQYFRPELIA